MPSSASVAAPFGLVTWKQARLLPCWILPPDTPGLALGQAHCGETCCVTGIDPRSTGTSSPSCPCSCRPGGSNNAAYLIWRAVPPTTPARRSSTKHVRGQLVNNLFCSAVPACFLHRYGLEMTKLPHRIHHSGAFLSGAYLMLSVICSNIGILSGGGKAAAFCTL